MTQSISAKVGALLEKYMQPVEYLIELRVRQFAGSLSSGTMLLDSGAGECRFKRFFTHCRYVGVDLAVGDSAWNYGQLDAVADVKALPFLEGCFDACLSVVVLEHVDDPYVVCAEMYRTLKPGGRIFVCAPFINGEHQIPHDYFRYTSFGLRRLLEKAGFENVRVSPMGDERLLLAMLLGSSGFVRSWPKILGKPMNKLLALIWTLAKAHALERFLKNPDAPQHCCFGWFAWAERPEIAHVKRLGEVV